MNLLLPVTAAVPSLRCQSREDPFSKMKISFAMPAPTAREPALISTGRLIEPTEPLWESYRKSRNHIPLLIILFIKYIINQLISSLKIELIVMEVDTY